MPIEETLEKFCRSRTLLRGCARSTERRYRLVVTAYARCSGIARIEEASRGSAEAFLAWGRAERRWSPGTLAVYRDTLAAFFSWCRSEGLLSCDPLRGIPRPMIRKRLPRALTKAAAVRLLSAVRGHDFGGAFLNARNRAVFATFLLAGLRKGELLALGLEDVDMRGMAIRVRGAKWGSDRAVPISRSLARELREYVKVRALSGKKCGRFFLSAHRDTGFTEAGMKRLVARASSLSGVRFTAHALRHTFATLMLEGGCDVYSLSRLMGHSDIKMTARYLSASSCYLKAQIEKHPLRGANR